MNNKSNTTVEVELLWFLNNIETEDCKLIDLKWSEKLKRDRINQYTMNIKLLKYVFISN